MPGVLGGLGRRRATGGEHRLLEDIQKRFPKPGDVDAERLGRAAELKVECLRREPEPEPNVAPYWTKYQQVFSVAGLPNANPQDLRDLANSNMRDGKQSVYRPSRYAYQLAFGKEIRSNYVVEHYWCDNPICVRADETARATDLVARRRFTRTCQ